MKRVIKIIFAASGILFSFSLLQGCLNSDDGELTEQQRFLQETQAIDAYLEENNIEPEIDFITGIRYTVENQGNGLMPFIVDSVTIRYTGVLLQDMSPYADVNSTKVAWADIPAGFRKGLSKIQEGGAVTVYLPSYYAYGPQGTDEVPPHSTVIAVITLEEVHAQQLEKDIAAIDDSLSNWGIQAQTHPSGIRYILDQGEGETPTLNNQVLVNYNGRLLGKETSFDSGLSRLFPLSNLILGWQIILPLVQEGGKVTLYIPSSLGYGKQGSGSAIPPNSNLVFEIDLLDIR